MRLWMQLYLWFACSASVLSAAELDYSSWNPNRDGILSLQGDWEVYWGKFYKPEDFASSENLPEATGLFPYPGVWNNRSIGEQELKANHYATYRVVLKLSQELIDEGKILTLAIPNVPGAYKLWVNGKLAIEFGKVAKSAKREKPKTGSRYFSFQPTGTDVELLMQISSFSHRDGGTWWPIKLGSDEDIARLQAVSGATDGFVISCLFIMAFYHLGIYLLRRQQKTPLFFAIFCTIISFRTLVTGPGEVYLLIYPDFPHFLQKMIEYAGFYLSVPAFYTFVRRLYPKEVNQLVGYIGWGLGVIFSLSTLLPSRMFTNYIEYYQVIAIILIVSMLAQLVKSIRKKRDGVWYLLAGTLIMSLSAAHDIMHAHRLSLFPFVISPYGLFMMILFQAILLAKRFSRAFLAVEISEKKIHHLNAELQNQNALLDKKVEEKTRDIRSILSNIKQGIFTVTGENITLGSEYSDHLKVMIEAESMREGESFNQVFDRAVLTDDKRHQMDTVLSSAVGEDAFAFEANAHLLPKELLFRRREGDTRILEVDWNAIVNEHTELVDKVLVSLRDVTDLRRLQEDSRVKAEELQLMGQVLNVPLEKFEGIIHSCRKFIEDCQHSLQQASQDFHHLFRNMHTIKGVARSYGLHHLANASHQCEAVFADLRSGKAVAPEIVIAKVQEVGAILDHYDDIHKHKLGRVGNLAQHLIALERDTVMDCLSQVRILESYPLDDAGQQRLFFLSQRFIYWLFMPLEKLIEDQLRDLPKLAFDLQKETPFVHIHDPGISFIADVHDLLRNVFTHLLRNAMDHGIESAGERMSEGKPTQGNIHIRLRMEGDYLEIMMRDDGRGIDLRGIEAKARAQGLLAPDLALNDHEIANLIFLPNLSTKQEVSEISGRGVGLDAVRNFVEQFGGSIEARIDPIRLPNGYRSFMFFIVLPKQVCEEIRRTPQEVQNLMTQVG